MGAPGARDTAAALAVWLARWRVPYSGRPLFRVAAGPRWVRLHLAGDERFCLLLATVPGGATLAGLHGRLPEPLAAALPSDRDHPLPRLLAGATLTGLGALPGERVACFRLAGADGSPLHLLHQLFGPAGNTVLLDAGGRCLWAERRPPHILLAAVPAPATYDVAVAGPEDGADAGGPMAAAADGLETHGLDRLAAVLAGEALAQQGATLARRLRAAERLCAHLAADLAAAGDDDGHRRRAEALAAHLHELRPGTSRCELADLRDGAPLVIDLDPSRSPAANLAALFHRARKAERGREVIASRLAEAQATAVALRAALDRLSTPMTATGGPARLAEVQARLAALPATAASSGATTRGRPRGAGTAGEEPARPFRRYLVDGRWEVWVGRSSRENDDLTHGAAHARDVWLHVHGATGSHVVIRTAGRPDLVPRGVLEKAAALAALHSKSRNASLVPVIWTEKRYVRKPRKSPPGLAVTLQAQTLMVAPGIADGVEPA